MNDTREPRLPPSIEKLRPLLASSDVDRVAALAMALLAELADLGERVAKLEGADPAASQARIARLVERVLARA
jgi:hypothetical protein